MLAVCTALAGCSDVYYDRRDTIAFSGGDAVKTNEIVQMVDPWPRASANREIPYDGQKMQSAVERYRTNKVIPPNNGMTSSSGYQAQAPAAAAAGTP